MANVPVIFSRADRSLCSIAPSKVWVNAKYVTKALNKF